MIAQAPKSRKLLELATRVATTDATVLIEGESGTGKEVLSRVIHDRSRRAAMPFVAFSCAALGDGLIESQLFGHERGSFTGAFTRQLGLFEIAQGGTILLDEIGETSPVMQVKLLRVIESREFRRVGGSRVVRADVRVIAATNLDLRAEVERGNFRADLYYRLAVIRLRVPPLRERRADIPHLIREFAAQLAEGGDAPAKKFTGAALARLARVTWRGNARELRNCVERIVIFAAGPVIDADEVLEHLEPGAAREADRPPMGTLANAKREHYVRALSEASGNKMRAARLLGVNVKTLYAGIERYGIG